MTIQEMQTITKKDILRRLRKDDLTVLIVWIVMGGFFAVCGFVGVFSCDSWDVAGVIPLILAFLCIAVVVLLCTKGRILKKEQEFHIIQNPVNHISQGDNLADSSNPTEVYFNYHNTYGRYRYTFYTYKKGDGMQDAQDGKLFYLIFSPISNSSITEVDLVFPVDATTLDSELAQKLREDAHLTGNVLPVKEGLFKPLSGKDDN